MSNQYVTLNFEFKRYKNEETVEQSIHFEGYKGWQNIQFYKKPPSQRQIELLAELSRILTEFGEVQ